MHDPVNKPKHYSQGKIQPLDIMDDKFSHEEFTGYLKGNIFKYLLRYKLKNGVEDLKKAEFYLKRLITKEENHEKKD